MKRKPILILLTIVALALGWCMATFADGTCPQNLIGILDSDKRIGKYELTFDCTADASAATYPATAISAANLAKLATWYLYRAETKPGATAPTDLYDITIVNANGVDVVGGLLLNRSSSTTQDVLLWPSTGYYQVGLSTLTVTPTGNSVNSAGFRLILEFGK